MTDSNPRQVDVEVVGDLARDEQGALRRAVLNAVSRARLGVEHLQMRVTPVAGERPGVLLQINLATITIPELTSRSETQAEPVPLLRVQVIQTTLPGATATALRHLARKIDHVKNQSPEPWPDPDRDSLAYASPGKLARVKSVDIHRCCAREAAITLTARDYDAHLFTDTASGEDAILYRSGPTGWRIQRQHTTTPLDETAGQITTHTHATPWISRKRAVQTLTTTGLAHLFFTDGATGRGNLLYRRHDGQLTVISPAPPI